MEPINLFLDFDSTIVNTSEVVLEILNKNFHKDFKIEELKKYDYSDLFPEVNGLILRKIFHSDYFFSKLKFIDGCFDIIGKYPERFRVTIVTKTSKPIDVKKTLWLNEHYPKNLDYTVTFVYPFEEKNKVDMSGGVFIDDVIDNIRISNAKVKILYAPNSTEWNKYDNLDEIYVASSWKEINDILDFMTLKGLSI